MESHLNLLRASLGSNPHSDAVSSKSLKNIYADTGGAQKTDRVAAKTLQAASSLGLTFDEQTQLAMQESIRPIDSKIERALQESLRTSDSTYVRAQNILLREDSCGLFNLGNTCWMNSLIQAVFKHSGPYYHQLEKLSNPGKKSYNPLAHDLLQIIQLSEKPANSTTNEELINKLEDFRASLASVNHDFAEGQHDPADALNTILQTLGMVPDKGLPLAPSIHRKTYLRAVHSADFSSQPSTAATQINLSKHGIKSIQESLKHEFMNPTPLVGVNGIKFGGKETQDSYKIDYFTDRSAPEEIIVQAPRFNYAYEVKETESGPQVVHTGKKNLAPIEFNETIRIPLYNDEGTQVTQIITMQLQSIVGHIGSLGGGHYIAYQKNEHGYILYDDSKAPAQLTVGEAQHVFKEQGYLAVYKLESTQTIAEGEGTDFLTLQDPRVCPAPLLAAAPASRASPIILPAESEESEDEHIDPPRLTPLQPTATPSALFLQPEEIQDDSFIESPIHTPLSLKSFDLTPSSPGTPPIQEEALDEWEKIDYPEAALPESPKVKTPTSPASFTRSRNYEVVAESETDIELAMKALRTRPQQSTGLKGRRLALLNILRGIK